MKLTSKEEKTFAVLDEVFEPEVFERFYQHFNSLDFAYRSMTGWQKVWRITDGLILAGAPNYHRQAPFGTPMDWLHQTIVALAGQYVADLVGKEGEDWNEIVLTPYIYPAGTKISWHDDYGYTGACIFYPHREWSPHWGGELCVAKTPPPDQLPPVAPDLMNRAQDTALLNHYGMGVYINPLPNRLVFTSGKVWHSINRVDQSAGDHCRCSVVAFFMKS